MYQATKEISGRGFFQLNVVDLGRSAAGHLTGQNNSLQFQMFSVNTGDIYTLDFSYMDFDALFRFNAELMNPNRRTERYFWTAQRLEFEESKDGLRLVLGKAPGPTDPLIPVFDKADVPSFPEPASLSQESIEALREERIREREKRSLAAYMEKLKRQAPKVQDESNNQEPGTVADYQGVHADESARQVDEDIKSAKIKALEEKRRIALEKIEADRKAKELQASQAIAAKLQAERRKAVFEAEQRKAASQPVRFLPKPRTTESLIQPVKDQQYRKDLAEYLARSKLRKEKEAKAAAIRKEKKQAAVYDRELFRKKCWASVDSAREIRKIWLGVTGEDDHVTKTDHDEVNLPKPPFEEVSSQSLEAKREKAIADRERARNLREVERKLQSVQQEETRHFNKGFNLTKSDAQAQTKALELLREQRLELKAIKAIQRVLSEHTSA